MAKVKDDVEYSNKLRKAHDIMKILDLPDSQDSIIRKELLKQNDKVLEDLGNKSKKEIQNFLLSEKEVRIEQKISKIKSVFTPQILEQNPNLAKEFNNLDKE